MRNFRPDYAEKMPDYEEINFLKLIKLFPRSFPTYKVHVKVFMTCSTFFSHLLTGISLINAVFPRFLREEWIYFGLLNLGKHPKLSNLVTVIQAPRQKMHGMPGG